MTHTRVRPVQDLLRRLVAAAVVALLGAGILAVATAAPAQAAARLSVSSSLGGDVASASGPTTFTVSGSGFQSIAGGFGGIYVGFGWVNGSGWGPSRGGATGSTYDYVPDEQSRENQGYQAFVAFPGSSTSGEAQGMMSGDGSFRVQLAVPGPTFTGAGGKRVDCLTMTCGFFTWGAHGVQNGSNETFTPVTFQAGPASAEAPALEAGSPEDTAPGAANPDAQSGRVAGAGRAAARSQTVAPAQAAQPRGDAATATSGDADTARVEGAAPDGQPADALERPGVEVTAVIEVDRRAARPGGAMGFAAAGFWPGEQVYVVLGDGAAAVGPVVAGVDGEVAGVMVLPQSMDVGTHEIRAAGAGSGLEAAERFPVQVDIAQTAASTSLGDSLKWIFLAISALVLLAMVALVVKRRQDAADLDLDPDAAPDHHGDADRGEFTSGGPALGGSKYSDEAATATPFPHPAMAGTASMSSTAVEKKDL